MSLDMVHRREPFFFSIKKEGNFIPDYTFFLSPSFSSFRTGILRWMKVTQKKNKRNGHTQHENKKKIIIISNSWEDWLIPIGRTFEDGSSFVYIQMQTRPILSMILRVWGVIVKTKIQRRIRIKKMIRRRRKKKNVDEPFLVGPAPSLWSFTRPHDPIIIHVRFQSNATRQKALKDPDDIYTQHKRTQKKINTKRRAYWECGPCARNGIYLFQDFAGNVSGRLWTRAHTHTMYLGVWNVTFIVRRQPKEGDLIARIDCYVSSFLLPTHRNWKNWMLGKRCLYQ